MQAEDDKSMLLNRGKEGKLYFQHLTGLRQKKKKKLHGFGLVDAMKI